MSARRLRILFLAPEPFLEVRGTPLAVLAMVRALTSLGHEVHLLTFPQGTPVEVPGLRHHRSLGLTVGRVRAGASLAKLALDVPFTAEAWWRMATGGYDLVHAVEEAAFLAAPLARLLRLPLVSDVDSAIPEQLRESGFARRGPFLWMAERLESHALRHSAAVVTVCDALTQRVRERAPGAPVFQVEDPPLVDESPPDPAVVARLRASLGVGSGPVVLYAGNFEPYQGVELLVEAAAALPEARFVLVGGEAREVQAMRARAAMAGVLERCIFTGRRPPSDLPAFLALADLLASPRLRGDNTPFKVYTYLAAGKPIVATRLPTHTQLLDETTAFLAEPTAAGLAAAMRQALADAPAARARAARGLALLQRQYSGQRYLEKVRSAYHSIAQALPARSGLSR